MNEATLEQFFADVTILIGAFERFNYMTLAEWTEAQLAAKRAKFLLEQLKP